MNQVVDSRNKVNDAYQNSSKRLLTLKKIKINKHD